MKKIILCLYAVIVAIAVNAQEPITLQQVTEAGNTTDQPVHINAILANSSNSAMVHGRWNNITSSINTFLYGYNNSAEALNSTVVGYANNLTNSWNQSASVFDKNNTTGGHAPMAYGYGNYIDGGTNKAIAVGRYNSVYGFSTSAFGGRNNVDGDYAMAVGSWNNVTNTYSAAFGNRNTAEGYRATAVGYSSKANGTGSVSVGYLNEVTAEYASAFGYGIINNIAASVMIGTNNASKLTVLGNGNVLINRTTQNNSVYKLDVNGWAHFNKVVVNTNGADFVFDSTYRLAPLAEVETFIKKNSHLPGIAPAKQMQAEGMDVGDQQTKLLQKVEELTLYLIAQSKEIAELKAKAAKQEMELAALKKKSGKE